MVILLLSSEKKNAASAKLYRTLFRILLERYPCRQTLEYANSNHCRGVRPLKKRGPGYNTKLHLMV